MSLVSVVIPAFNRGDLLERAVRSVLDQTVSDIEVVVVDDGSTQPQHGIQSLDPRIRFYSQPNRGVSIARNVGVQESKSEMIAFLDHDDVWLPDKLGRQLDFAKANSGAAFWATGFSWTWPDKSVDGIPKSVTYLDQLAMRTTILPSTVLLRKSDYLDVGGSDPLYTMSQDVDLFLRLSMEGREPAVLRESLVHYHLHAGNASRDYRQNMRDWQRLHGLHEERALRRNDQRAVEAIAAGRRRARELFAYQALDAARHDFRAGSVSAVRHLAVSIRTRPAVGLAGVSMAALTRIRSRRPGARSYEQPSTRKSTDKTPL